MNFEALTLQNELSYSSDHVFLLEKNFVPYEFFFLFFQNNNNNLFSVWIYNRNSTLLPLTDS